MLTESLATPQLYKAARKFNPHTTRIVDEPMNVCVDTAVEASTTRDSRPRYVYVKIY